MHALRVLEFDAILERLARHCETSIGAAFALELKPSFDSQEVWRLLAETKEGMDFIAFSPPPPLGGLRDTADSQFSYSA